MASRLIFAAGASIAIAVFGVYQIFTVSGLDPKMKWFTLLFGFIGSLILCLVIMDAILTKNARSSRCIELQRLMEGGIPSGPKPSGQAEAKDRFQAYGCRWAMLATVKAVEGRPSAARPQAGGDAARVAARRDDPAK